MRRVPATHASPSIDDPALGEIVWRLVRAYHPTRLYLFWSAARATSGPDSDYDLLVAVPDDVSLEGRQSRVAYEALRGTGIAADVLVCTQSYFDDRLDRCAALPATIVREGVLPHVA